MGYQILEFYFQYLPCYNVQGGALQFQELEVNASMSLPLKEVVPKGWVQTDRASHEAWAKLIKRSPLAATIMHLLAARVGDHNAVVISQKTLAGLASASRRGVQSALKILADDRWLQLVQIGGTGTVQAHVLNDTVVWSGPRDGLRYSKFSAVVIVSAEEQPGGVIPELQEALRKVPRVFPGEQQLPTGEGLPPPSEMPLPGLEPDIPAILEAERRAEPVSIGSVVQDIKQRLGDLPED